MVESPCSWETPWVERFGARIEEREIPAESADHAVADGAAVRRGLPGEYEVNYCSPAKRAVALFSTDVANEPAQDGGLLGERITERASSAT